MDTTALSMLTMIFRCLLGTNAMTE